jgi:hypothetical protein
MRQSRIKTKQLLRAPRRIISPSAIRNIQGKGVHGKDEDGKDVAGKDVAGKVEE